MNYGIKNKDTWCPKCMGVEILTIEEMRSKSTDQLEDNIHSLLDYPHEILFYGNLESEKLTKSALMPYLNGHETSGVQNLPELTEFMGKDLKGDEVYFLDYEMEQVFLIALAKAFGASVLIAKASSFSFSALSTNVYAALLIIQSG